MCSSTFDPCVHFSLSPHHYQPHPGWTQDSWFLISYITVAVNCQHLESNRKLPQRSAVTIFQLNRSITLICHCEVIILAVQTSNIFFQLLTLKEDQMQEGSTFNSSGPKNSIIAISILLLFVSPVPSFMIFCSTPITQLNPVHRHSSNKVLLLLGSIQKRNKKDKNCEPDAFRWAICVLQVLVSQTFLLILNFCCRVIFFSVSMQQAS